MKPLYVPARQRNSGACVTRKHERRIVRYSADQMYDLVADIVKYPDFIPWCVGMRVREGRVVDGSGELVADMIVRFNVFRETFRSRVRLHKPAHTIDVDYLDGPFRRLENHWRFEDRPEGGSIIDFRIAFEFRNPLLQATAMGLLDKAFARLADAFIARADDVYGAESGAPGV